MLEFLQNDKLQSIGIPIATYVLGFLTSRFTMSKKDRKDVEQTLFENGKALMKEQEEQFQNFATALQTCYARHGKPTFDDFMAISKSGEKYFYQQRITCDAILTGKVDRRTRDNTLVPSVVETVNKSLPAFYSTLQSIAKKNGLPYQGELKRENFESLYLVVEKYSKVKPIPPDQR